MRRVVVDISTSNWKLQFARSAERRRAEEEFAHQRRSEKQRTDRQVEKAEEGFADLAAMAVMATDTEIAEFTARLETYETATVEALIANQEALDRINAQFAPYLARAETLPDGRRVFETRDGTQVFDEFGAEVTDEIHPDLIDDGKPRWEEVSDFVDERNPLLDERQVLLDYQERLDEGRELVSEGNLTSDELEDLETSLEADMPLAVRQLTPGYEPPEPVDARSEFSEAASDPSLAAHRPILDAPSLPQ
jgi:hypothetical protein